jgi:plastocyanin
MMIDTPPPPAHVARAPARLLVEATEFHFTLSRTTLKAGPAVVQLASRGEDPHDLRLARVGATGETLPGDVGEWSGRLKPGRYKLYCSLPGHERAGMRAFVTVR